MRVVVLMGGTNLDRDTSLVSGWQVAQALREVGHEVAAVDTARPVKGVDGEAFSELGEVDEVPPVRAAPPSYAELARLRQDQGGEVLAPGVLELCRRADRVFVALFGQEGEGGALQGVLQYAGVCHTGPELLGCAVTYDKEMAKRVVRSAGVPTAEWVTVARATRSCAGLERLLPAVVKPVAGGSSVGASVVHSPEMLADAVATAHATGEDALVERLLPGREFTVGVLRGKALPPVELLAGFELIDYERKYQPGRLEKQVPADLCAGETETLGDLAVTAHEQLKLGQRTCSRMDFRMDERGDFVFMECNPLPGMTPASFLPLAAQAAGLDFPTLCDDILSLVEAPIDGSS